MSYYVERDGVPCRLIEMGDPRWTQENHSHVGPLRDAGMSMSLSLGAPITKRGDPDKCPVCNEEYIKSHNLQIYCRRNCRDKMVKARIKIKKQMSSKYDTDGMLEERENWE